MTPVSRDVALRHELSDMVQRARLGGAFYVAGWVIVGLAANVPGSHPWPFALGLGIFGMLGALRLVRPPPGLDANGARGWILRLWTIVWLSTGLWSLASVWVLLTCDIIAARVLVLVLLSAFGTTLSHVLAMRASSAAAGLGVLFVPQILVLMLQPDDRLLGVALLIYFVYLMLVMRRARGEYWQRVALQEEIRAQRDFFEQQSRRDGLTGLPNRRRLDATLAALLPDRAAARIEQDVSLILFDLDHFKRINDQRGHAVGDHCLIEFARLLSTTFNGHGELPARLGGEEFAVVLPRCRLADAVARAESLRRTLAATPMLDDDDPFFMTVSGGVVAAEPGDSGDALLARADVALYHSKRSGRDRIVSDSPTARHEVAARSMAG